MAPGQLQLSRDLPGREESEIAVVMMDASRLLF